MATFTRQISDTKHDGFSYNNSETRDDSSLWLGRYNDYPENIYLLFDNVTIPQGATITAAKIQYKAESSDSSTTLVTTIYANDVDSATEPADYAALAAKVNTTAYTEWTVGAWVADNWYDSPDIKSVIQEIVDRSGWASGNDLMILHWGLSGSGSDLEKNPYDHTGGSSNAAKLVIEYTVNTPVTAPLGTAISTGLVSVTTTTIDATVTAPLGTALSTGLAPTTTTTIDATVTAPLGTALSTGLDSITTVATILIGRQYLIDGESVIVDPSWSISDKINGRTTLSITVVDLQELTGIDIGDPISLTNGSDTIFAGIVHSVDVFEAMPSVLNYNVKCVDNSALADKRLVAETGSNQTAGYIAENVILPYLADEGVIKGTIEAGVTISKYTFNYITASKALDQIRTVSGLNWNIDKDKKLNLFSNTSNLSPWTLDDTVQHTRFQQSKSMSEYRNVQYVRAGKAKTSTQTLEKPSPKPDGVSRTFRTKYPIAEKPTIVINSTPVDAADVGIKSLDTGKKWYFTYNSQDIVQDSSETVLADIDVLEITYVGLYDILILAEDETEITNRASAETGTSGRYEHITEEKSLTEVTEAQEYGQGLLSKYADIADNITFETNVSGLEAGQLLTVDKALYGISANLLIESINISPDSPSEVVYSVKALDGAALGGWEEYFKEILRKQTTYVINENEVIIKLKKFKEVLNISESLTFPETDLGTEVITLNDTLTATSAGVESRVGYAKVGYSEVGA